MKKKLLFVIESLHLGGAEKSLVTLFNSVDLSDYEVQLWVNTGGVLEKELPSNIQLKKIPKRNPTFLERINFYLLKKRLDTSKYNSSQIIWKAFGACYKQSNEVFDIAISYHQGLPTYFICEKVIAKKKVSWLNTDYKLAQYDTKIDQLIFDQLDKIIAVSAYAKKTLTDAYEPHRYDSKIEVLEDFIDTDLIIQQSKESCELDAVKQFKIVTVGRLNPTKGYPLAIKAGKILKDQGVDFKWFIVGEGSERILLEGLIKEYKLESNFELVGAKSNPYSYMRAADLYVQTSVLEGFSISVREAKILNKAIVCTNFPSIQDAIIDLQNGLLTEMNESSIAHGILEIYKNPDLVLKFIGNLKSEKWNSKQEYASEFLAIIKELMK